MAYMLELNLPGKCTSDWENSVSKGNPTWKLGGNLQLLAALDTPEGLRVVYIFQSKDDADRFLERALTGSVSKELGILAENYHGHEIQRLVTVMPSP